LILYCIPLINILIFSFLIAVLIECYEDSDCLKHMRFPKFVQRCIHYRCICIGTEWYTHKILDWRVNSCNRKLSKKILLIWGFLTWYFFVNQSPMYYLYTIAEINFSKYIYLRSISEPLVQYVCNIFMVAASIYIVIL
jgi:hypothetical protein